MPVQLRALQACISLNHFRAGKVSIAASARRIDPHNVVAPFSGRPPDVKPSVVAYLSSIFEPPQTFLLQSAESSLNHVDVKHALSGGQKARNGVFLQILAAQGCANSI